MNGIIFLLSGIVTVLVIMAERGVPVKWEKYDTIMYTILFMVISTIALILNK